MMYSKFSHFSHQVLSIRDVNSSEYFSRKKITTAATISPSPSMKRLYVLNITDGVSELKAMEYQRMDSLDCNIEQGMKVSINKPINSVIFF